MNPLNYEIKMTIKNLGKMQGPEKGILLQKKIHSTSEQSRQINAHVWLLVHAPIFTVHLLPIVSD